MKPETDSYLQKAQTLLAEAEAILKAIADYQTGPDAKVPPEVAAQTIESGKRFVAHIGGLLAAD